MLSIINKKILDAAYTSVFFRCKKIVLGEGLNGAKLAIVGEAPGADEEKSGRPFVGRAGRNLDTFLLNAGLKREEIYVTNTVKIRPVAVSKKTGGFINRSPDRAELEFFTPFLMEELNAVSAKVIATMGNTPLKAVAGAEFNIGGCHGRLLRIGGYNLFPMYHPAAIIYNRGLKAVYEEDMKKLSQIIKTV